MVKQNNEISYIDTKGNKVFDVPFQYATGFSDGLAIVGDCVIYNDRFDWLSNPLMEISNCGYINPDGEVVIDTIYDEAYPFHDGVAYVTLDGESFFINKSGKKLFKQNLLDKYSKFEKGLAYFETDYERGYVNKEGNIAFSIDKIKPHIGMTEIAVNNSLWGEPKDINRTTTTYGVNEQWCYSLSKYVYLENGIVTAIQE